MVTVLQQTAWKISLSAPTNVCPRHRNHLSETLPHVVIYCCILQIFIQDLENSIRCKIVPFKVCWRQRMTVFHNRKYKSALNITLCRRLSVSTLNTFSTSMARYGHGILPFRCYMLSTPILNISSKLAIHQNGHDLVMVHYQVNLGKERQVIEWS